MKIRYLNILLASLLASGCAVQRINGRVDAVEGDAKQADTHLQAVQQSLQKKSLVEFSDSPWVDTTPIKIVRPIAKAPELACRVTFAPEEAMSVLEFAQRISRLCGVPIRVAPDVVSGGSNSTNTMAAGSGVIPALPSATAGAIPSLPGVGGASSNMVAAAPSIGGMISDIKYDGPVSGLLDTVTSRLGVSWSYEKGGVKIYYTDTRVFSLFAIPTDTIITSTVQSGTITSGGGGSSGSTGSSSTSSGSSQETGVTMKANLISDITNNLKSMLTPGMGRISLSAATGAVTVTDTPDVLDRIGAYLDNENKAITQQVIFEVKVLSVTLNDSDSGSLNWDLVNAGSGTFGGALTNSSTLTGSSDVVTGTLNVVSGKWKDSSLLVKALSQQGRVSVRTSQFVPTLNMQPAPAQVATQQSYLASIQTTSTDGSTSTSMTPGTVTTGFNLTLLPYVLTGTEDMLLQYSVNLSSLNKMETFSSGDNTIQLPNIDNRIFSQRVKIHSGESLVLSGFEQTTQNVQKNGVGSANNILFGGGMAGENERQVIVILVTPKLVS